MSHGVFVGWHPSIISGWVFGCGLQADEKRAAIAQAAAQADLATASLHGPFGNCKTKPGSTVLAGAAAIDAVKSLEDSCMVFVRDAHAIVADFN